MDKWVNVTFFHSKVTQDDEMVFGIINDADNGELIMAAAANYCIDTIVKRKYKVGVIEWQNSRGSMKDED